VEKSTSVGDLTRGSAADEGAHAAWLVRVEVAKLAMQMVTAPSIAPQTDQSPMDVFAATYLMILDFLRDRCEAEKYLRERAAALGILTGENPVVSTAR